MIKQVYPPNVIVRTIIDSFFKYRNLTIAPRSMSKDVEIRPYTNDDIISDMEQFHYVRIDASRNIPRGQRYWVVVVVLSVTGKYSHHSPELRKLLDGVKSEKTARDGKLDELIVVAEEEFFKKKNMTDVIKEYQSEQPNGADYNGVSAFYNAYPYYNFVLVVPESNSVPPHRLMSKEEVDKYLTKERLAFSDLPVIFTNDPPIVWLGGREGEVVEIERPSQTAGKAFFMRRIQRNVT